MRFRDRADAGRQLAARLAQRGLPEPIVVLALPRGGVPVAALIAEALRAPLEVFVARKIGAPGHQEFGIGAVAEGSEEVVVTAAAARLGLAATDMQPLALRAFEELRRQVHAYREGRELPDLAGRTVVLVDDGLATGVTAEAAMRSLRRQRPRLLILAVPVCPADTLGRLSSLADEVICLVAPKDFQSVGQWYERFDQTTDEEVQDLLTTARSAADDSR